MSESKSILDRLRENNPFVSSASPFPFENTNPDLQQLSRSASEEIEQLLRHKRRSPNLPLAGLILGEAGSGKTHMLMRILRRLRGDERLAIFVAVKTLRAPENVAQHILSEIFISLKHTHSDGHTQFDMLTSEIMNAYKERRRSDGFSSIENIDLRAYLSKDMPKLDKSFLKCILLYLGTSDEAVKADILDWLNEGLEDEDSMRLGLPSKDLSQLSDARRESIAEKTLISLGTVLAYAKVPMVICFDQLDSMRDRELIDAWGNVIALLMNDLPGVLPLCFMRAQTWNDVFMPVLDDAVVQRLRSNSMMMTTCSLPQAKQLIRSKIESTFKEESEAIYEYLINLLGSSLTPDLSPRSVIDLANNAITGSPKTKASDETSLTIQNVYSEEYKKVQAESHNWPPSSDNLTLALEVWLSSLEGFEVSRTKHKNLRLNAERDGEMFAFVVVTAKNHFSVSAGLKHGMSFMREYPEGRCYYVTEDKTHKKTWKQANENLDKFRDAGGNVIMLDKDTRINWYALTALINRVDNGDVDIYFSSKPRTASRDDIKSFIRSIKLIPELMTPRPKASGARIAPDVLGANLKSILGTVPMNMLALGKAIEMLANRKVTVSRDELLSFLRANAGSFKMFRSNNDVLIAFAAKR